jgi:hypothetical protein
VERHEEKIRGEDHEEPDSRQGAGKRRRVHWTERNRKQGENMTAKIRKRKIYSREGLRIEEKRERRKEMLVEIKCINALA